MSDKREDILARLYEIMEGIRGISTVARNLDGMTSLSRPCLILIDGDEVRSDSSAARNRETVIMIMTPNVSIGVSSTPEGLSGINTFRRSLVSAILTDTELATILGSNGRIIYEGCASKLSAGNMMASDMQLNFSIAYPFNPRELL